MSELDKECHIIAKLHPFAGDACFCKVHAGQTLLEMVGDGASDTCELRVNGEVVPRQLWGMVRPKPGTFVHAVSYPQGGGSGNKWLRTIALVVVAYLSYGASSYLTAAGYGAGYAAAAGAAVGILGNMAINSLIPPPTTQAAAASNPYDQLSSLTGTSNQASPYGVIPCVLGTMTFYPPHAALPYTEISGDDQYLRMLLDLGYGNIDVSNIQIGGTDISSFDDVEWEVSTAPTLFSQDIYELAVGVTMDENSTTIRTTQDGVSEISVDFLFPQGLFAVNDKGKFVNAWQFVTIDFAVSGTDTWYGVAPPTAGITISDPTAMQSYDLSEYKITSSANKTLRVGIRWKVPGSHAWDVRVQVGTAGYDPSVQRSTAIQWSVMRSIHSSSPSTTGTNKLAVRIKATDQLNGVVSNLSVEVQQNVRTYDSDTATFTDPAPSQNPAWHYLWLMTQCPAVQRRLSDDRMDLDGIAAWAAECESKGYLISTVMDSARALFDIISDVLASGRATFGMRNGKYSPVRDIAQTVPIQMFTPANSWGFNYTRTFNQTPDALKVTFTNPQAANQQDVVVLYNDGFDGTNAQNFVQIDMPMIVDPSAAWRLAKYHMSVLQNRPTTYQLNIDVEHIVCERGDLVHVAHDIISWGLAYGRVKSVNGTRIVLDGFLQLDSSKQYQIRVRRNTNDQTAGGMTPIITWDSSLITLDSGMDWDATNGPTPVFLASEITVEAGDLYVVGEVNHVTTPMIVRAIAPSDDLTAQLTLVDAAPDVWTADSGTPPPFVSQITDQPWNKKPAVPDVLVRIGGSSPDGVGVIHTVGGTSGTQNSGTYTPPIGCVAIDSLMQDARRADQVKVGDVLELADEKTLAKASGRVSYSDTGLQPCVEIVTESGATLQCSVSAPIPTHRGLVTAPNVAGKQVAVLTGSQAAWEKVKTIRGIGKRDVQHITCENGCFWAGSPTSQGKILHHNMKPINKISAL